LGALENVELNPRLVLDDEWRVLCVLNLSLLLQWYVIDAGAKEDWRATIPPKVKFFFWLTLHGCLWTAKWRKRHGVQDIAACTLFDQDDETTDHLLDT
jgi:hypothetical protein